MSEKTSDILHSHNSAPHQGVFENLFTAANDALAYSSLGNGKTASAYPLPTPFNDYIIKISFKELDKGLKATTMLYPVNILAQEVGEPLLMNESGSIQIQKRMPGKTIARTYEDFKEQLTLKYPNHASTLAYIKLLKTLVALPNEVYSDFMKTAAMAAENGLANDWHKKNIFLQMGEFPKLRAIDYHHWKGDGLIAMPDLWALINGLSDIYDPAINEEAPAVRKLQSLFYKKCLQVQEEANKDPTIRSHFEKIKEQPFEERSIFYGQEYYTQGYIRPKQLSDSWLDRMHGRQMQDITSIQR